MENQENKQNLPVQIPSVSLGEFLENLNRPPIISRILIGIFFILLWKVANLSNLSLFQYFWPNRDTLKAMTMMGAMDPQLVSSGEYWRLLFCIFLHHGLIHFLANSIGLHNLGTLFENLYGKRNFLIIFLLSGLSGSTASWWFSSPNAISAGASGALFGLIGSGLVFTRKYRSFLHPGLSSHLFKSLSFWAFLWIGLGFIIPQIDNSGHLGGLAGGLVCGLFLCPRNLSIPEKKWEKALTYSGLLCLLIFLVFIFSEKIDWKKMAWKKRGPVLMESSSNEWISFSYPKGWKMNTQKEKGRYSIWFKEGPTVELEIRNRDMKQDLDSFIEIYFEEMKRQLGEREFFKIPRKDRFFPRKDKPPLGGKSFGYGYRDRENRWVKIEVELAFSKDLIFFFRYSRLEEDSEVEEFFQKIKESIQILQDSGDL